MSFMLYDVIKLWPFNEHITRIALEKKTPIFARLPQPHTVYEAFQSKKKPAVSSFERALQKSVRRKTSS